MSFHGGNDTILFTTCFTQAKKSKKKTKPEVKPTQAVSSADGKEPDEGTKLSVDLECTVTVSQAQ